MNVISKERLMVFRKIFLVVILLLLSISFQGAAADDSFSKEEKVMITTIGGMAAVTTWGIINWDYFANSPKAYTEGWFSKDTKRGGVDKLGHFQFSYTLSHVLAGLNENWGYTRKKAAFLGSVSSFAVANLMELGDSFSDHGFSYEDFIANFLGSAAGYYLYTNPKLSEKLDFRVEYNPNFSTFDVFTDYDRLKYLAAIKLGGFDTFRNSFAKYLDLHIGYYTRQRNSTNNWDRNLYVAVGINISAIFEKANMPKTAKIFNYLQLPYTYIDKRYEFDD